MSADQQPTGEQVPELAPAVPPDPAGAGPRQLEAANDAADSHRIEDGADNTRRNRHSRRAGLWDSLQAAIADPPAENPPGQRIVPEGADRVLLLELLQQMFKYVIIMGVPSGRLILANAQAEAIWRQAFAAPADLSQYSAYRGSHPNGLAYAPHEWPPARAAWAGEIVTDEEIDFMRGDATPGTMRVSAAPVFDQQDRVVAVVTTFYEITERKRTERALQQYAERLSSLSHQLLVAQERERQYIARELHDQMGQALTALKINLQAAQGEPAAAPLAPRLGESIAIVDQMLDQVRDLALHMRPSMLDNLGLVSALRWYLDRTAQQAGLAVRLSADSLEERLPPDVETACFRVAQEALTNAVRHAQARQVTVALWKQAGDLHLVIGDDGGGFNVAVAGAVAAQGASLGLLGMEERVQALGGQLTIDSALGRGTTVSASFPLTFPAAPPDAPVPRAARQTTEREDSP